MNEHRPSFRPGGSLKSRYLLFAALVTFILIGGSVIASLYVSGVTRESAETLQLHDDALGVINRIRKAVWWIDTTLNTQLISPQPEDQQTIRRNLFEATRQLSSLSRHPAAELAGLEWPISQLQHDLEDLSHNILRLMELQQDPDWVYPMLPYINETLVESNTEFETAAYLALQEIADDDGGEAYASRLYRAVAEVRDLWRHQILDFRAVIIRFAGLNREEHIAQEQNIDVRHEVILARLTALEQAAEARAMGPATEDALETMLYRAGKWYADYQELQKLRASNIWRADVHFIEVNVHPLQLAVEDDITALQLALQTWSTKNVTMVEQAANQINAELWGLTIVTLAFVWLMYVMISRSVLTPIARIAHALTSDDGANTQLRLAQNRSSREIQTLVSAYNTMRQQIHHRQSALQHQALHDSLTDLPNRALLHDRLQQAISQAQRNKSRVALLLLDLDRFKEINDTLGHATGDQVLKIIARRLADTLRKTDTVARLGGDEFAIVSPQTDGQSLQALVDKIVGCINQPIGIDGQNLYVGVSIGIAVLPEHGEDADTLIRHADIAMYSAKRGNRSHAFYNPRMDTMSADNLSLLGDLRQELQRPSGQLQVYYQPQIELATGRVHSAEALLRWKHPQQGFQAPDQVIHMAEQAGLIGDLTTWVLRQAIGDGARWRDDGLPVRVAVNLSAWNLQDPQLPSLIHDLLAEAGLPPGQLSLEITESVVMSDPVRAREVLHQLSEMGIDLAIDDYGSGFSSLAYLKMLPVKDLKIDKSFVIDMLDDENDAIIVRSTVDLAHNLRLTVIAEGVEQAEVLQQLRDGRCDYVQGYFISPPLPETEFRRWCADNDPWPLP